MVDADKGFVVAPGSSEALATAVRAFLALPAEKRAAMGAASKERVESRFTWPVIARQTLDAIARIRSERA